jgi:hypothetical protein
MSKLINVTQCAPNQSGRDAMVPKAKVAFLAFRRNEKTFGINFGSAGLFCSGIRSTTGINLFITGEDYYVPRRNGINLSVATLSNYPQKMARHKGINVSLMDEAGISRGINVSVLSAKALKRSGINVAVSSQADEQNGITIGLANEAGIHRGITAGLINKGASKGVTVSMFTYGNGRRVSPFNDEGEASSAEDGKERDVHSGINASVFSLCGFQKGINLGVVVSPNLQAGLNVAAVNDTMRQAGVSVCGINKSSLSFKGISLAAVSVAERFAGIGAGIVQKLGDATGVAVSAVSKVGRLAGLCVSALYAGAETLKKGVLIAPVTKVEESRDSTGLQIGLLNIRSDADRFKYLPGFAISREKD